MKINKSIFLVISFGVLTMSMVFIKGMPVGADFANHFRFALPFYDELMLGNYFSGWLAESNNGFGDPRFRFYPPVLYYLLCLGRFLTNDWYASTLIVFTFFSVIGTLGVYFWARESFSERAAVISAFIFAFAPYHLTQFYQASLLGEFAAISFIPYAVCFVERLSTKNYKNPAGVFNKASLLFDVGGLATAYSLVVSTHLPTTVIVSLMLGIYALLLTNWSENNKSLLFCALGIFVGLISSSWFWFKMLSELGWIQAGENVSSAYYDYRNNFLLSPNALVNLNSWYGNLLLGLTIFYLLPTLIIWFKIYKRNLQDEKDLILSSQTIEYSVVKKKILAILTIIIISILMTTELSRPLWAIIPKLKDIQFPYRWLSITSVFICLIIGISLPIWRKYIKENGFRPLVLVLFLAFFSSIIYSYYELVIDANYVSRNEFIEQIENGRTARSFKDWLPKNAAELKDLIPMKENVEAGKRKVTVSEWSSLKRVFSVEAGVETTARIRAYNYPLWQAFILKDGQKTQTATNSETDGTLIVEIPTEKAEIEVVFVEPPRTAIANWVSIIGWLVILGLLVQGLRLKRDL